MFRRLFVLAAVVLLLIPGTAAAQQDLSQTYTSFDGALSFNYPAGWFAWGYDNDWGYVANSEAARDISNQNGQLVSGQVVIGFNVLLFATPDEIITAEEMLVAMQGAYSAASDVGEQYNITVRPLVEPALVAGMDNAVETTFQRTTDSLSEEVLNVVIINGNTGMVELNATAPVGESARYHDLALNIAASIRFIPPSAGGQVIPGAGPAPTPGSGNVMWIQERAWGSEAENFGGLSSLSIGADDRIYVVDSDKGVHVLDAAGNVLYTVANTEITHYSDVEVVPDGTLWIVNDYASKVYHLDAQGNLLFAFGEQGSEPGQFADLSPAQIEVGADGNLYIGNHMEDEGLPSNEILVYAPDGTFIREFPTDPNPDDGYDLFANVYLAAAPDGTLYAGDMYTMGIKAFAPDGTIIRSGIGAQVLEGVLQLAASGDGALYSVGPFGETIVYQFDPNGNLLGQDQVSGAALFVSGMGVLSDGSVIVAGSSMEQDTSLILRLF